MTTTTTRGRPTNRPNNQCRKQSVLDKPTIYTMLFAGRNCKRMVECDTGSALLRGSSALLRGHTFAGDAAARLLSHGAMHVRQWYTMEAMFQYGAQENSFAHGNAPASVVWYTGTQLGAWQLILPRGATQWCRCRGGWCRQCLGA